MVGVRVDVVDGAAHDEASVAGIVGVLVGEESGGGDGGVGFVGLAKDVEDGLHRVHGSTVRDLAEMRNVVVDESRQALSISIDQGEGLAMPSRATPSPPPPSILKRDGRSTASIGEPGHLRG